MKMSQSLGMSVISKSSRVREWEWGVSDMEFAAKSHVGLVRKVNEDGYWIGQYDSGSCMVVVADGMGGYAAGEVASSLAVKSVKDFLSQSGSLTCDNIITAIEKANAEIYGQAMSVEAYAGMGTTIVLATVDERTVQIAHVGDSRAYLLGEDGTFTQLTEDHSLVNELVRRGQIKPEEAAAHPQRHLLTRALGTLPVVVVEYQEYAWREGDMLLVCSDGLTGSISAKELAGLFAQGDSPAEKVELLIEAALARGGHDNITVVAVANEGEKKGGVASDR